jgi:hypothetical protein
VYGDIFDDRPLPSNGYVNSTDSFGIAFKTSPSVGDYSFFSDYFWNEGSEERGIIRGGFWGNGSDAGIYSVNIAVPPSFIGPAVGFRCVKKSN